MPIGAIRNMALAAMLGIALSGGAALAQEEATTAAAEATEADVANNSAFGDWLVNCEAVSVRRSVCRLSQELSRRDDGALVARFIAMPVEDGVILVSQVPMGAYLPGGAVYRFAERDDLEQREMIWQRCLGDICEAAAPISTEELALFDEADAILFGYRMDLDAEPVVVRVDVSRFSEAVAAIRAQ